jgi:hypothetical protein
VRLGGGFAEDSNILDDWLSIMNLHSCEFTVSPPLLMMLSVMLWPHSSLRVLSMLLVVWLVVVLVVGVFPMILVCTINAPFF